jgi:acyl-CoA synthetase (AMP-forming)/AMP-acid ligase II
MNTAILLHNASRTFGDRPALSVADVTVRSYGELSVRVARLAAGLKERLGLLAGERVALVMDNSPEYFEVLFAVWHAGLTAVPINAKLHSKEVAYILAHCCAAACFVTAAHAEDVSAAAADVSSVKGVVCVDDAEYDSLFLEPMPIATVDSHDLAWLFYTSGTTGRPKGAMLSHLNLQLMTWSYLSDFDYLLPGDAFLLLGPMSHAAGLLGLGHIAKAANNVLPASGGFDPAEIAILINLLRNVTFFGAPTMLKRLVESPAAHSKIENIRTIIGGGAPFYAEDVKRILATFGPRFSNGYGQGECPSTITWMPKHLYAGEVDPHRLVSVGIARSAVEVRTVDAEDRDVPVGEAGEIIVRSDIVMRGYLDNPAATARALRGGWLYTGDVGVRDAQGYFWLKDRSKDLIISGGSNIYPREVEDVLLTDPDVADVAVVGEHDAEWGELVVAFVVARVGTAPTIERLDRLCLSELARFKRPRRYILVDALPRNSTGKVLKSELRERLAADRQGQYGDAS